MCKKFFKLIIMKKIIFFNICFLITNLNQKSKQIYFYVYHWKYLTRVT